MGQVKDNKLIILTLTGRKYIVSLILKINVFACCAAVAVQCQKYIMLNVASRQFMPLLMRIIKSEIRMKEINQLKSNLSDQQSVFTKHVVKSKNATIASLKISHMLAKKKKPFQGGHLLKETFLTGADCLFEGFSNKRETISAIQDLQLSNNTVARRICPTHIQNQLKSDMKKCNRFSLQFDESTDLSDIVQLAVMVEMVFSNFTVEEDLLKILHVKGRTTDEDIYNTFKTYTKSIDMPFHKLSAITTYTAPAMVGIINGFIALCKKDYSFPNFMSYHWVTHHEVLCSKILPLGRVMKIVFSTLQG